MTKLSSAAIEVVNRNALVTVALNRGYNAFLPVCDEGIDLILHNEASGDSKLIQLKGRWTIDKKYVGRDIWIAFPDQGSWYVVPHDELIKFGERHLGSSSWAKGAYNKPKLGAQDVKDLEPYRFGAPGQVIEEAAAEAG